MSKMNHDELPVRSAYIGPFPLDNAELPRIERWRHYALESQNLAFALDSDFICGNPVAIKKLTKNKNDFWRKYHLVIILNFPTLFHYNRENWYYDLDLPEQIRKSNPTVKIGIHTEGWPTHFMSYFDPILITHVIRWLESADFIISTERRIDTSAYRAFNKKVFYIPYPIPQEVRCADGLIRPIISCRVPDHEKDDVAAVGGRWFVGIVNGYTSLRLAASLGLKIKTIDDLPLEKFPLFPGNKNILETASGLPMSQIIQEMAPMSWEEYHKRLAPCRLMINLNNQHTFGRAGIDCAIPRVPMVCYDCVETAREFFPETTVQTHDYLEAEKIARKLIAEPKFWNDVAAYADAKLASYSYEKSRTAFVDEVLPRIMQKEK